MFETLTIKILRSIIRDYNLRRTIRGYSKMNKTGLVSAIQGHLVIDNDGNITLKEDNYKNTIELKPKQRKARVKKEQLRQIEIEENSDSESEEEIVSEKYGNHFDDYNNLKDLRIAFYEYIVKLVKKEKDKAKEYLKHAKDTANYFKAFIGEMEMKDIKKLKTIYNEVKEKNLSDGEKARILRDYNFMKI